MGAKGSRVVYDGKDLTTYSEDTLKRIDRAILAAAYRLRDEMRHSFISGGSLYKHHTPKYDKLAEGITVGKLRDSKVKIHALGTKEYYDSYKTRFFVGGTSPRTQIKQRGKNIKPYTKGYIKANQAIDIGIQNGESTLTSFINNVLKN